MSILGPDGEPVTPPPAPTQPTPAGRRSAIGRAGVWGLAFVLDSDTGKATVLRFNAEDGDIVLAEDPSLPAAMFLLRGRPTERGHLTFDSAHAALEWMAGEVDAQAALDVAQQQVVADAEATTAAAADEGQHG